MCLNFHISILSTLFFLIFNPLSSAQTAPENQEKKPSNVYVEIMKLNDKISFLFQQFEEFQNLSIKQDGLIKNISLQLNLTKQELKVTKEELKEMKDEVEVSNKKLNFTEFRVNDIKSAIENCACARTAEQVYNSIIKPELQIHRRVGDYYKEKPDFTWTVKGVGALLPVATRTVTLESQRFQLRNNAKKVMFKLDNYGVKYNYVLLSIDYNELEALDYKPAVYCTIKDISGKKKDLVYSFSYGSIDADGEAELPDYEYDYTLWMQFINKTTLASPAYVVDDTMSVDIHVEPPEVAKLVYSYDGKLTWLIDHYTKRKTAQVEGLIGTHRSPYFKLSEKGPRMQVSIHFNGHSKYKSKGLTMTIHALDNIYVTMERLTSVTLFNPVDVTRNVTKRVLMDFRKLLSFTIEMGGSEEELLLGDTLYYQVVIGEADKNYTSGDKFWSERRVWNDPHSYF